MNKKILYVGLAIFAIALVGIVCMNVVHAEICKGDVREHITSDGVTVHAKSYGCDGFVDKRSDRGEIKNVVVKSFSGYKDTKIIEKKVKNSRNYYITVKMTKNGQFGKLSTKKVKNVYSGYLKRADRGDYECMPSKIIKISDNAYNHYNHKYKVSAKLMKTYNKKYKYVSYQTVSKTSWKTVKWNTVYELFKGVCKLPKGYKYGYNTYNGNTVYSHYKKTVYKDKPIKHTASSKYYVYRVKIKVSFVDYSYQNVKYTVNKPVKIGYVY